MANMKVDVEVEGMTCASCSARVEKALNNKDGVVNAVVNLLAQKATIEYDRDKLNRSDLIETIEGSGYDVPIVKRTYLVEGMT